MLASPPTPRVWIFLDRFQSTPVSTVYLPNAHPLGATASVTTIDIVGTPGYPGTNAAPPPGFTLASRETYRGLSLSVFRAPHPVAVTPTDFDGRNARVVTTGG
jgi:hypothetical protein